MADFDYTAKNPSGKTEKGGISARDKRAAIASLQARGLAPIRLVELRSGPGGAAAQPDARNPKGVGALTNEGGMSSPVKYPGKVRGSEKHGLLLARRMLDLQSGGLSTGDSVHLLQQRLTDVRLRGIASEIWGYLREGHPFARAAEQVKGLYSRSILCLFEAGEASGDMVSILRNVIEYLEEKQRIRKQLAGSMAYPCFVIAIVFAILLMFLFFLMPRIQSMIDSMGGKMNFFTQMLVLGAEYLVKMGPFVLIGGVVAAISLSQWRRLESGRVITDRWLLRIPLIGTIANLSAMYQTSNLMQTLLGSGINTTEMLKLTERTISNLWIRARFSEARTRINEGMSFSQAFRQFRLYPDTSIDILSVGENTGNLSHGLKEITSSIRSLLSDKLRLLTVSISALAMATAFVLVLFVALGMILSVYEVTRTIGR